MKKTFQKTLIAAAAGVALMSAVGTASANSLLFPYFSTAAGATSVLSLQHTGAATEALHYVYNYGPSCVHYDASGSITANDTMSHTLAGPASTTVAGIGKIPSGDSSTPVFFPLSGGTTAANSGFLVVSTRTTASTSLRGSMAIVDTNTGLVTSYAGIDNGLDTSIQANEGNFSANTDLNFGLAFLPQAYVSTSWFGVVVGDMSAAIAGGLNWGPGVSFTNGGNIYNNDEVAYSGTTTKAITCAGSIIADNLMTSAQLAAVGVNGGLVRATGTAVASTAPAVGTATGAVLVKMQTIQAAAGAPFAGKQLLHREVAGL